MKSLAASLIALLVLCSTVAPVRAAVRAVPSDAAALESSVDDDAGAEGDEIGMPLTASEQARLGAFAEAGESTTPAASELQLDPEHKVPAKLLATAVDYYRKNLERIANKDTLTIVDFSSASRRERMFFVDMRSGRVATLHVAHGSGSDPRGTGTATIFKNEAGSNCSSLGFYLTAETYSGKHGYSLRLDGLSATNSNVRERAVVIHGADYVRDADVLQGRSWGCLAVSMAQRTAVIDRLKGGSLIYAGLSAE